MMCRVIGEGEAFHRTSPDGNRGEKASLHSPARFTMITRSSRYSEARRLLRITQYVRRRILHDVASSIDGLLEPSKALTRSTDSIIPDQQDSLGPRI